MVGPPLCFLFGTWTGDNGRSKFSLSCTGSCVCGRFPFELIPAEDDGCVGLSRLTSSLLERWPRVWLGAEEDEVMVLRDGPADIGGNVGCDEDGLADIGGNDGCEDEPACSPSWALKRSQATCAAS